MNKPILLCWNCGSTNVKSKAANPYQAKRFCGDCGNKKEIFQIKENELGFYQMQINMINCAKSAYKNPPKNMLQYYYQRVAERLFRFK